MSVDTKPPLEPDRRRQYRDIIETFLASWEGDLPPSKATVTEHMEAVTDDELTASGIGNKLNQIGDWDEVLAGLGEPTATEIIAERIREMPPLKSTVSGNDISNWFDISQSAAGARLGEIAEQDGEPTLEQSPTGSGRRWTVIR